MSQPSHRGPARPESGDCCGTTLRYTAGGHHGALGRWQANEWRVDAVALRGATRRCSRLAWLGRSSGPACPGGCVWTADGPARRCGSGTTWRSAKAPSSSTSRPTGFPVAGVTPLSGRGWRWIPSADMVPRCWWRGRRGGRRWGCKAIWENVDVTGRRTRWSLWVVARHRDGGQRRPAGAPRASRAVLSAVPGHGRAQAQQQPRSRTGRGDTTSVCLHAIPTAVRALLHRHHRRPSRPCDLPRVSRTRDDLGRYMDLVQGEGRPQVGGRTGRGIRGRCLMPERDAIMS